MALQPDRVVTMLAAAPAALAEATAAADPQRLRTPPAPGEWSAVEVLAHLRTCADVWGGCIATILAEDEPTIRATNPRTYAETVDYGDDFAGSLRAFIEQREELVRTLRSLDAAQWERGATGRPLRRTVLSYAEWLATHERPHLKQVARAAAS
jgi:hypothetical protein